MNTNLNTNTDATETKVSQATGQTANVPNDKKNDLPFEISYKEKKDSVITDISFNLPVRLEFFGKKTEAEAVKLIREEARLLISCFAEHIESESLNMMMQYSDNSYGVQKTAELFSNLTKIIGSYGELLDSLETHELRVSNDFAARFNRSL